jgi:hypothetical protein
VNVRPDDAMELGQLLQFLDDWLATDHGAVNESLTRFVGCDAYDVQSLRRDLARFTFLLGESDGEGLFSLCPSPNWLCTWDLTPLVVQRRHRPVLAQSDIAEK